MPARGRGTLYHNCVTRSSSQASKVWSRNHSAGNSYITINSVTSAQKAYLERAYKELTEFNLITPQIERAYSIYCKDRTSKAASYLIEKLTDVRRSNHLPNFLYPEYLQLVRNKATGEKKKFRAKHRLGVPKGYELIGTLEINYVWGDKPTKSNEEEKE